MQAWSSGWSGNLDASTDDYACVSDSSIYTIMQKGAITAQNCPFVQEIWTINYQVIRKCNILIENLRQVDEKQLSQEEKDRYEAEARFLRAFCYFDLIRTFGKTPLITYAQDNYWPFFRYAEILLNYAEAQNEALGAPDQSVYDAVNDICARAGLP
ncbi:MAG: RagB/SusD family nutrient uptake outer membrane protein [Tannerellaceae bacterium]|nr:RagB/SusD family nutrient uptake outer membrane protein [Tannerellaceae bacterium]